MKYWKDIKHFPKDGTRCLIKLKTNNIVTGFYAETKDGVRCGIIDESYTDSEYIEFCDDPIEFLPLTIVDNILWGSLDLIYRKENYKGYKDYK